MGQERNAAPWCSSNVPGGGDSCTWWLSAKGMFLFLKKGGHSLWREECWNGFLVDWRLETPWDVWVPAQASSEKGPRWKLVCWGRCAGCWPGTSSDTRAEVSAESSGEAEEWERKAGFWVWGCDVAQVLLFFPFWYLRLCDSCAYCVWSKYIFYVFKISDLSDGWFWSKGRALLQQLRWCLQPRRLTAHAEPRAAAHFFQISRTGQVPTWPHRLLQELVAWETERKRCFLVLG